MKNIILFLTTLLVSTQLLNAQCTPGAETKPLAGYIIPDSATNFAVGCAGQPYEQIIYIKAPKDTQVTYMGMIVNATIDSFVVDPVIIGLPNYLTVQTVPGLTPAAPGSPKSDYDRLIIKGDSLACMRISGNIPAGTSGTFPLVVSVRAYLTVAGLVQQDTAANVNYYHIDIMNPCYPAGISQIENSSFHIVSIAPNPATTETQVRFTSNEVEEYSYRLVNSFGQVIFDKKIKSNTGMNIIHIDVNSLSDGTYLFNLSNGKNVINQKVFINK